MISQRAAELVACNLCAFGIAAASASVVDATAPLLLHVTPRTSSAPGAIQITVTVERDTSNRSLLVEDESDHYYRGSEVPLEGVRATRTHKFIFRGLPAGRHEIRAVVRGSRDTRLTASTTITVLDVRAGPES